MRKRVGKTGILGAIRPSIGGALLALLSGGYALIFGGFLFFLAFLRRYPAKPSSLSVNRPAVGGALLALLGGGYASVWGVFLFFGSCGVSSGAINV